MSSLAVHVESFTIDAIRTITELQEQGYFVELLIRRPTKYNRGTHWGHPCDRITFVPEGKELYCYSESPVLISASAPDLQDWESYGRKTVVLREPENTHMQPHLGGRCVAQTWSDVPGCLKLLSSLDSYPKVEYAAAPLQEMFD